MVTKQNVKEAWEKDVGIAYRENSFLDAVTDEISKKLGDRLFLYKLPKNKSSIPEEDVHMLKRMDLPMIVDYTILRREVVKDILGCFDTLYRGFSTGISPEKCLEDKTLKDLKILDFALKTKGSLKKISERISKKGIENIVVSLGTPSYRSQETEFIFGEHGLYILDDVGGALQYQNKNHIYRDKHVTKPDDLRKICVFLNKNLSIKGANVKFTIESRQEPCMVIDPFSDILYGRDKNRTEINPRKTAIIYDRHQDIFNNMDFAEKIKKHELDTFEILGDITMAKGDVDLQYINGDINGDQKIILKFAEYIVKVLNSNQETKNERFKRGTNNL